MVFDRFCFRFSFVCLLWFSGIYRTAMGILLPTTIVHWMKSSLFWNQFHKSLTMEGLDIDEESDVGPEMIMDDILGNVFIEGTGNHPWAGRPDSSARGYRRSVPSVTERIWSSEVWHNIQATATSKSTSRSCQELMTCRVTRWWQSCMRQKRWFVRKKS